MVFSHISVGCCVPHPKTSKPRVQTCVHSPGMITVLVSAGAAMLMGYEEQGFLQPLTSQACNNFLDTCTAELGTDASASAIAAMKSVVEAMQMGQLPAADAHTYSAAVHCRIEALQHEAPSQTVLVDLYRHLLPEMHQALGRSSSTCRVYAVAMCQFAAAGASAEIVQLLLLMIQNEVVGLDSECSLLIMDELVKDASELMWDWLQDKLGEDFLDAMTAVSGGTTGQLVLLPAKADVPQLRLGTDASGREKLVLADEPCPDWMAHPTWGDQSQSYSV